MKDAIHALPPFLMSSVPKSGTHLLHQILTGMPNISMDLADADKKFFIDDLSQLTDTNFNDHFKRLQSLSDNEFGLGHLWYTKKYADRLKALQMKHIFLHRDPRDLLISMSYFIKDHWKEHILHEPFQTRYTTLKERHFVLIAGEKDVWPGFYKYILRFYEWLDDENTFHISFEELMENEQLRRKALREMVNYLWEGRIPPLPMEQMVDSMVANIHAESSNTFRSGKIGSWKKEFDVDLKQAFKHHAGELLTRFGYENDNDW